MMQLIRLGFSLLLSCCVVSLGIAEPQNLADVKKELVHYHDSSQYEKELNQTLGQAKQFLHQQLDYYKTHKSQKKLAIVFDIDETSVSNYNHIIERDFSGDKNLVVKDISLADAPSIKATLSLYHYALKNHVNVFFVSGRRIALLKATERNLKRAGFNQWAGLYLRPESDKHVSIVPFKSSTRAKIEKQGYLIVLNVGDQDSDLAGGHAVKGVKLPNPFYKLP